MINDIANTLNCIQSKTELKYEKLIEKFLKHNLPVHSLCVMINARFEALKKPKTQKSITAWTSPAILEVVKEMEAEMERINDINNNDYRGIIKSKIDFHNTSGIEAYHNYKSKRIDITKQSIEQLKAQNQECKNSLIMEASELLQKTKSILNSSAQTKKHKELLLESIDLIKLWLEKEERREEPIAKIGKQAWMKHNLDVDKFCNGDLIPHAKSDEEWEIAGNNKQPAWCYYKNDHQNGLKYGKLYNWYAIIDKRRLAPIGWHIPDDDECTELTDFLGGESIAGNKLKAKLGWKSNGNGTDEFGFSALPGGYRWHNGNFGDAESRFYFWSSTKDDAASAWIRYLSYDYDNVCRFSDSKSLGFSVRCLRDID